MTVHPHPTSESIMRLFGTASLALIGTVLVLPLAIIGAGLVQWTWPEAFGIEDGSGVGFVIVILPLAIPFSVGGFFLLRWAGRRMSRWVWLGPAIPLLLLALRALIDMASRLGTDGPAEHHVARIVMVLVFALPGALAARVAMARPSRSG